MTQDEIIRSPIGREQLVALALEAGFEGLIEKAWGIEQLERFAALVAAHEREACAKVCEQDEFQIYETAERCAAAIRARSEK